MSVLQDSHIRDAATIRHQEHAIAEARRELTELRAEVERLTQRNAHLEAVVAELAPGRRVNGPTPAATPSVKSRTLLRTALTERLTPDELRALAVDIGADADDLAGDSHPGKATSLVTWAEQRQAISKLVAALQPMRPDIKL